MNEILRTISNIGIVPVVTLDDADKAVPLARALVAGGLPVAEITFRAAAAGDAIRAIVDTVPEMLVGAGTVLTPEQLDQALEAGARFVVSPGFNPEMVKYGLSKGALMLPGTATGGEMEQAMSLGLEAVKFFPAEQNGGIAKLKALAGPYRKLKWMPTGGINGGNLAEYLSFPQVIACGGTWMVKKDLIEAENWAEITRLTREAVDTMLGFSLAHVGINCLDAQASERTARTICGLFGLPFRAGNSSNHAGTAVECTKAPGPGVHGHIAIGTNSVERAIYHLERRGVAIDHATCKTDAKGRAKAVYLEGDFGGFAIHLVQK